MASPARRHTARHKTLTLLSLAGIALGAAVFVAIPVANQSALRASRASVELVAGRAQLEVTGNGARFDESVLRVMWKQPGVAAVTPGIEQIAAVAGHRGEYLKVLGVDPFSNGAFRTWRVETRHAREARPQDFFSDPRAIAITETIAARLGLSLGDEIDLFAGGRRERFRVQFFLRLPAGAAVADARIAVMDIANAQEIFDCIGRLSRVHVLVAPGASVASVRAALQAQMPPGVRVQRPERRTEQVEGMLQAFQLNLAAISLISLLVGMFLIHNTVAAGVPSREAFRAPPLAALSPAALLEKGARGTGRTAAAGLACLAAGAPCAVAARTIGLPWLGFGTALLALLGFVLLVPVASLACARALSRITPARFVILRLSFSNFAHSLHRNSLATAALVAALAMFLGVTIMIHSFRTTVGKWLTRAVTADLFVAPASNEISPGTELLPAAVEALLRRLPVALAVNGVREIHIPFRDQRIAVAAADLDVTLRHQHLAVRDRDPTAAIEDARHRGKALVTEAFSRRFGLRTGDRIPLTTPAGCHEVEIAGVFTDYSAKQGLILMDRSLYQSLWGESAINSAAIYLKPGEKPGLVRDRLRRNLAPHGEYLVYSNADVRRRAFAILDQAFDITTVLRLIALVVSGLGICLALTILVTERQREIGLLRAAGVTRAQIRRTIHVEALLIGLVGTALGVAAGFALAAILNGVINVAFFGWTIGWATPWPLVLQAPLWVLPACAAAGLLPAIRAARLPPAGAAPAE